MVMSCDKSCLGDTSRLSGTEFVAYEDDVMQHFVCRRDSWSPGGHNMSRCDLSCLGPAIYCVPTYARFILRLAFIKNKCVFVDTVNSLRNLWLVLIKHIFFTTKTLLFLKSLPTIIVTANRSVLGRYIEWWHHGGIDPLPVIFNLFHYL